LFKKEILPPWCSSGDGIDLYGIGASVSEGSNMVATARAQRARAAAINQFVLYSMAASVPGTQLAYALLLEAVPGAGPEVLPLCVEHMGVPNNTRCLSHLMDASTLSNFYMQVCTCCRACSFGMHTRHGS
jgi:hypothetical protein